MFYLLLLLLLLFSIYFFSSNGAIVRLIAPPRPRESTGYVEVEEQVIARANECHLGLRRRV